MLRRRFLFETILKIVLLCIKSSHDMFVHFIFLKTTFFCNYSVNYRCPSRDAVALIIKCSISSKSFTWSTASGYEVMVKVSLRSNCKKRSHEFTRKRWRRNSLDFWFSSLDRSFSCVQQKMAWVELFSKGEFIAQQS